MSDDLVNELHALCDGGVPKSAIAAGLERTPAEKLMTTRDRDWNYVSRMSQTPVALYGQVVPVNKDPLPYWKNHGRP